MNGKTPPPITLADRVKEVVRFDRFYAQRLRDATKVARVNEVNAAELGVFVELLRGSAPLDWLVWRLDLDRSYLARTLKTLEISGFVTLRTDDRDRRMRRADLTTRGRTVAQDLQQFQEDVVRKTLEELPTRQQRRLVRAMGTIIEIFERDELTNFWERFEERR